MKLNKNLFGKFNAVDGFFGNQQNIHMHQSEYWESTTIKFEFIFPTKKKLI